MTMVVAVVCDYCRGLFSEDWEWELGEHDEVICHICRDADICGAGESVKARNRLESGEEE